MPPKGVGFTDPLWGTLNAARFVTIVGSGRETLQVEGEHVYRRMRLLVRRTTRGSRRRLPRHLPRQSCSSNARRRAARTWTSAMRKPQSWSASAPGTRGDASSGGAGRVIDVHARQQRSGACVALNRGLAIAQQPRDAPNQLQLLSLLHMFHHRIGDFKNHPALRKAQLCRWPRPLRLHPPSRWPIPLWGVHSTISAISAAPAWSLRQRYSVGRTISGPARSISTSNTTITSTSPWQGPCGCKAIPLRRQTSTPERQGRRIHGPSGAAIQGVGVACLGVPLGRRSPECR
jgi:hypothetical protein